MQQQLIKSLSDRFSKDQRSYSSLDQYVFHYLLEKRPLPSKFTFDLEKKNQPPLERLALWRNLLKVTLISYLEKKEADALEFLKETWYELSSNNSFKKFQLEQAYTELIAYFLHIPYESKSEPIQIETGLSPIEAGAHWPWMNTPTLEWHAELGTLWALLAYLKDNPKYALSAQKLAYWQIKGLDCDYKPFKGFLSSHHFSRFADTYFRQAVLFHAIACISSDPKMAYLAKRHFSGLMEMDFSHLSESSSDALILLYLFNELFKEALTPIEPKLESTIQDPNAAFIGLRSSSLNVLVSLMGANMPMGSLRKKDVEISAFGPQLELLGEGKYFGFLGQNPLKKNQKERFQVDTEREEFNIKGVVGLPKIDPNKSFFKTWRAPSDWMEAHLFFEEGALNIHLTPYQVYSKLFFVFYAKAGKCLVNGEEKILPSSLNQYQGDSVPITLVGEQSVLILDGLNQKNQLKIIPLEGEGSFWGANYLIAYHLNNKYSTFKWKISTKDL